VASQYSDYPTQARRLADASASLLDTIEDPAMDRGIALVNLESASAITTGDLRARFEPGSDSRPPTVSELPEDTLAGLLLELQSANALMSAGMALNEHGGGADTGFLDKAIAQTRSTGLDIGAHIAKSTELQFAPQTEASKTLEDALKLFRDSAKRTLDSIAGGTEGVINSAFEKLKDVDKSKVSEAIDNLGESFEIVAAAGRLIRQGLEKLKAVLDSLGSIFGAKALADMKKAVHEVWEKFTGDNKLVRGIIGIPAAEKRVSDFAAQLGLSTAGLDGISRDLALLEDKYQGIRKMLSGLVSAVVLAMGIVAALKFVGLWAAAPWIPLAAAGAYAAIIGAALLVGLNYTGSRPMFEWIRGVCVIVPAPVHSRTAQ
jgi:hypothetical protein